MFTRFFVFSWKVIRWVDCGGAADRAGLRIGDRIVEVNGQNVEYVSHARLVELIKQTKRATDIVVVDEDYDQVYKRWEYSYIEILVYSV